VRSNCTARPLPSLELATASETMNWKLKELTPSSGRLTVSLLAKLLSALTRPALSSFGVAVTVMATPGGPCENA